MGRTVGESSRAASGLDGPCEADTTGAAGATRGCTTDPLALGDESGPEGVTATVSGEPGLAELVLGDGDIGVAASPVAVTKGAGVDDAESDGSTLGDVVTPDGLAMAATDGEAIGLAEIDADCDGDADGDGDDSTGRGSDGHVPYAPRMLLDAAVSASCIASDSLLHNGDDRSLAAHATPPPTSVASRLVEISTAEAHNQECRAPRRARWILTR